MRRRLTLGFTGTALLASALAVAGCGAQANAIDPMTGGAAVVGVPATIGLRSAPAGISVACGLGQQAVVRQVALAGQPIMQVECVTTDAGLAAQALPYAAATFYPAAARAIPVSYRAEPGTDRVVYERPATSTVRRSGRSWQKSAIVIGSSAGIGAGVGAAVGGKKGALIGAALGGGSAAIWDQVTRR